MLDEMRPVVVISWVVVSTAVAELIDELDALLVVTVVKLGVVEVDVSGTVKAVGLDEIG